MDYALASTLESWSYSQAKRRYFDQELGDVAPECLLTHEEEGEGQKLYLDDVAGIFIVLVIGLALAMLVKCLKCDKYLSRMTRRMTRRLSKSNNLLEDTKNESLSKASIEDTISEKKPVRDEILSVTTNDEVFQEERFGIH